ncbi:MAG TPA: hypothetical protein VFT29_11270 [Gemmatimonadaceae bacterium]|nr:hypothetical protein [Gemmatimonadaceae bacterium]
MRRPIVALTAVLALGAAVSCSDSLLGGGHRLARVVLTPQFTPRDAEIYSNLRTFDLGATSLQIVLLRPPGTADTVAAKSIIVDDAQDSIVVSLEAPIKGAEERLIANLEMRSGSVLIFSGSVALTASIGATHIADAAPVLVPVWVGPGNNATRIVISPRDLALPLTGKVAFTATAFDVTGKPVTDPDFLAHWRWRVNDPALGSIPPTGGEFVAAGKSGLAMVIVTTPNLLRDTVRISVGSAGPLAKVKFARQVEVLNAGATTTVPVSTTDQGGSPVANVTLTYTSHTPNVATVDPSTGVITGGSKGQAIILVRGQASGSQTFFQDSLLAVVADPAGPALISSIDRFEFRTDTTITVSVFADMRGSNKKLGSTALDVQWNPSQLLYQSFANGASGVAPTVNASSTSTGKLTLAMADVAGFSGRVELVRITFKTSPTLTSGSLTFVAKEITAADATYTDLLPSLVQVAHSLMIVNPQ